MKKKELLEIFARKIGGKVVPGGIEVSGQVEQATLWYEKMPYMKPIDIEEVDRWSHPFTGEIVIKNYNIPLIIQAVEKKGETNVKEVGSDNGTVQYECLSCGSDDIVRVAAEKYRNPIGFNFCPHCGLKINWQ